MKKSHIQIRMAYIYVKNVFISCSQVDDKAAPDML